jgi:hypothetical protein
VRFLETKMAVSHENDEYAVNGINTGKNSIWPGYVYKDEHNGIVFIHWKNKSGVCKKTQILWAVKRIEALNINKDVHPGYFWLTSAGEPLLGSSRQN